MYQNGTAITSMLQNSNSYRIELRYDQDTAHPLSDNFGIEAYSRGEHRLVLPSTCRAGHSAVPVRYRNRPRSLARPV